MAKTPKNGRARELEGIVCELLMLQPRVTRRGDVLLANEIGDLSRMNTALCGIADFLGNEVNGEVEKLFELLLTRASRAKEKAMEV